MERIVAAAGLRLVTAPAVRVLDPQEAANTLEELLDLADAIAPVKLALGEHVANRVVFKNYLQTKCAGFIQVDALRVAGVREFIAVSLLCKKFGVPVVPHVGDMGQLHQHLALFNHIALGHGQTVRFPRISVAAYSHRRASNWGDVDVAFGEM